MFKLVRANIDCPPPPTEHLITANPYADRDPASYVPALPETLEPSAKVQAYIKFSRVFQGQRNIPAAIHCLRMALSIDNNSATVHNDLAVLLERSEATIDDAAKHYDIAIKLDPKHVVARNNYALLLECVYGLTDEAITQLRACVACEPDNPEVRCNLGVLLETHKKDPRNARLQYEAAIKAVPNFTKAHVNLGLLEYRKQPPAYVEAVACFKEAVRHDDLLLEAHINAGIIMHYHLWQYPEAFRQYVRALEIDPLDSDAHALLGALCHEHYSNHALALNQYQQALVIDKRSSFACNGLGFLIEDAYQRYEEAYHYYLRALALCPSNDAAHYNIGRLFYRMGYYEQAIEAHERAIKCNPQRYQSHNDLGVIYKRMGNHTKAEEHMKIALSLAPKSSIITYNLAQLHRLAPTYPDNKKALDLFRETVAINPHDCEALYMAALLSPTNAKKEEYLRQALDSCFDYTDAHVALVKLYIEQSRFREAAQHCKQYSLVLTDPDALIIQSIRAAVQDGADASSIPPVPLHVLRKVGSHEMLYEVFEQVKDHARALKEAQREVHMFPFVPDDTRSVHKALDKYLRKANKKK